jgi:hypothetical protein
LFSCACVKFSGNDGEVFPDVHDGITNLFLRYPSQANKQGTFVHQAKYTKDLMKKFKMAELKPVYTLMSTSTSLDLDENGEAADQGGLQEHDWLHPVPNGDTDGHSVHRVPVCVLSGFPTLFTSDSCTIDF